MEPTTMIVGALFPVLWDALRDLAKAVRTALVPLAFGLICTVVAGVLYALLLAKEDLAEFFGSASQVGVGLLLALIVERVIAQTDNWLERQIRAGTVALTALGTVCALAGVVSDNTVSNGVLFGLAWGGIAAGTLGLFMFISPRASVALAGAGRLPDGAPGGPGSHSRAGSAERETRDSDDD